MLETTILGTSSTAPTKERNHSAMHLKYLRHRMLFDCGEGTQRQMMLAGLSPFKVNAIFITHLHADHWLGLGGLLETMNFWGKKDSLIIAGPEGTKRIIDFYTKERPFETGFPIEVIELEKDGMAFEAEECKVHAFSVEHTTPCFGFSFEEKLEPNLDAKKLRKLGLEDNPICRKLKEQGKIEWKGKTLRLEDVSCYKRQPLKVVYVMDTRPCASILENAKNANLLVCEATFLDELKKNAHDYGHMTAKDAAMLAKKAGAERLVLTHFSPRYENVTELQSEARSIFKNTEAARDLMTIAI